MISQKKLKKFVKEKTSKKLSKNAIIFLNKLIASHLEAIITKAVKKADFRGRVIIRKEDLQ
mgnify:CR=1 FL=1